MSWPIRPVAARFWEKVNRTGGPAACWPWTACTDGRGYGIFQLYGRSRRAHRVAFELWNARTPGEVVRHSCDNPTCCNPRHLLDGTHTENVADRVARGRSARGPTHGRRTRPESFQSQARRHAL